MDDGHYANHHGRHGTREEQRNSGMQDVHNPARVCLFSAPLQAVARGAGSATGGRVIVCLGRCAAVDPGGPPVQCTTTTGMLVWVSTLLVTLPSSTAEMPLRPCEAMMMASQPLSSAVLMIA
jgi:hypothetical protein